MFYVLDENKNLIEAYSKEDVLALLERAIADGDLSSVEEDSAFVSKFKSLIDGETHHIEFVTQAKYNELSAAGQLVSNTYYFITDDTTAEDLEAAIERIVSGETKAGDAEKINSLEIKEDTDGVLKNGDKVILQKRLIWSGTGTISPPVGRSQFKDGATYEFHCAGEQTDAKYVSVFRVKTLLSESSPRAEYVVLNNVHSGYMTDMAVIVGYFCPVFGENAVNMYGVIMEYDGTAGAEENPTISQKSYYCNAIYEIAE